MKALMLLLLSACLAVPAQTNTSTSTNDSGGFLTSGIVSLAQTNCLTDTDFVFTVTNSLGQAITDAVPVKISPNKVIYKCSSGGGTVRLASLPKELQEHFGYNKSAADLADKNDRIKQQQQAFFEQQQLQAAHEQAKWGVQSCTAHPYLYRWRTFGEGQNVDLQPLFNWWGYVSHRAGFVAQTNLAATPLKGWHRITASSYTVNESFWILDATIQSAPDTQLQDKIYLLHPPNGEKRIFEAARSELIAVNNERRTLVDVQVVNGNDLLAVNQRADDVAFYRSQSGLLNNQLNGASLTLSQQAHSIAQAQQNLANKQSALEARAAKLETFLNSFQNPSSYVVDFFAFDTGKTVNGMEVYDLGYISFQ